MRFAILARTMSDSTAMIRLAPFRSAPAVAHSPIGPWANTATVSPICTSALSAAEMPVEAISARRTPVRQLIRDFGEVGLGMGNQQVLRLGAMDGVSEL